MAASRRARDARYYRRKARNIRLVKGKLGAPLQAALVDAGLLAATDLENNDALWAALTELATAALIRFDLPDVTDKILTARRNRLADFGAQFTPQSHQEKAA